VGRSAAGASHWCQLSVLIGSRYKRKFRPCFDTRRTGSSTRDLSGWRAAFNAACALGLDVAILARPFRMVSISLSKGLGAPVGSVLAGRREDMPTVRRVRRLYGGAMRQAGIVAAAGLHALDHNVPRLI
jgi:threonine aldolase